MTYDSSKYWQPAFETALEQVLAAPMADHVQKRLTAVFEGSEDLGSITVLYLQGFEVVDSGRVVPPEVSQPVVTWVKTVQRNRSATRIAGITATGLCSLLEDFILEMADTRIDAQTISRLRASRDLPADEAKAKKRLESAVKPSVRAEGKEWLTAVQDVFGAQTDQPTEGSLLDMISFRNEYVHSPSQAFQATLSGEQIKSWMLATLVLSRELAS